MAWIETGMGVEPGLEIVTFADGTDEQIAAMLNAYYNDQLSWDDMGWSVGDTRVIHLDEFDAPSPSSGKWNEQDITVVIVDYNHNDLATSINGHTKACITVQTREMLSSSIEGYQGSLYIDGSSSKDSSFTKWSNLYMRTYLNDKVLGAIPSTFSSMIKSSKHYRHTTYNGSGSEEVTDTIFLPSYPEVFGTESYSYYTPTNNPSTEGTLFKYYETTINRIKYVNNNGLPLNQAMHWWTGSSASYYKSTYGYAWCHVGDSGIMGYSPGSYGRGLAPAWAM